MAHLGGEGFLALRALESDTFVRNDWKSQLVSDLNLDAGETLLRRATVSGAPEGLCISVGRDSSRQRKDRELAAERGVVAQGSITAHRA